MASKETSPSTFYTHQTDLDDISQPTAILHSLSKPLVLRIPQDKDLQPLVNVLADPENTKNDLSVASWTPEERKNFCRRWLTLNYPLDYFNFVVIDTATKDHGEIISIAGLAGSVLRKKGTNPKGRRRRGGDQSHGKT